MKLICKKENGELYGKYDNYISFEADLLDQVLFNERNHIQENYTAVDENGIEYTFSNFDEVKEKTEDMKDNDSEYAKISIKPDEYNLYELYRQWRRADTLENRMNFLEWFKQYDNSSWNGESYSYERWTLKPVWKGVGEPDEDGDYDQYEIVDVEIY